MHAVTRADHALDAPAASDSPPRPILDVRPAADFERGHRVGSVNIPLDELAGRIHELPHPGVDLIVFDLSPIRADQARDDLVARGRRASMVSGSEWLAAGPVATGPGAARLWQPHDLLTEALPLIEQIVGDQTGRRAADLACGTGRDAVTLAMRGYHVDAVDILPDALARADDLARRNSVAISTRQADLEKPNCLAEESYDLVVVFNFLHRPLLAELRSIVAPGGFLVYETFLKEHRRRFGKPRSDAHLLEPGELRLQFAEWRVLVDREGPCGMEKIAAQLVARRPRA